MTMAIAMESQVQPGTVLKRTIIFVYFETNYSVRDYDKIWQLIANYGNISDIFLCDIFDTFFIFYFIYNMILSGTTWALLGDLETT